LELFSDSLYVVFVVAFETILNIMVNNVLNARAMLGAETVEWWFSRVPGYHYLGGRREENAFMATNGAEMLMVFGTREEDKCSSGVGDEEKKERLP
jgi:hypothetical protein